MNKENFTQLMVNNFTTVENGIKVSEVGLDIQQFEQPYLACIDILGNEHFGEEKWIKMQDFMFDHENCGFKDLDELYNYVCGEEEQKV